MINWKTSEKVIHSLELIFLDKMAEIQLTSHDHRFLHLSLLTKLGVNQYIDTY
jgi:hypothetical protein